MQRMGMAIGLEASKVAEYKALHAAVWPEILALISESNVTNYSIFLKEPENLLFGYWEYIGEDFAADMARMAAWAAGGVARSKIASATASASSSRSKAGMRQAPASFAAFSRSGS